MARRPAVAATPALNAASIARTLAARGIDYSTPLEDDVLATRQIEATHFIPGGQLSVQLASEFTGTLAGDEPLCLTIRAKGREGREEAAFIDLRPREMGALFALLRGVYGAAQRNGFVPTEA